MRAAYRLSQLAATLTIAIRCYAHENHSNVAVWLAFPFGLAALLLLSSIVRRVSGNLAGAISLVLIALYPGLTYASPFDSISFFSLVGLMWLLVCYDWQRYKSNLILALVLAAILTAGATANVLVLSLSPVAAFGFALQRYVPADSIRPYADLGRSLRTDYRAAFRDLSIVAAGPWLFLAGHFPARHSVAFLRNRDALSSLDLLILLAIIITLWWLFVSIRSGSGVPFSLTAIPVAYGAIACFSHNPLVQSASPIHPIVLANLITLLGLWARGRRNKRVLDSTRN